MKKITLILALLAASFTGFSQEQAKNGRIEFVSETKIGLVSCQECYCTSPTINAGRPVKILNIYFKDDKGQGGNIPFALTDKALILFAIALEDMQKNAGRKTVSIIEELYSFLCQDTNDWIMLQSMLSPNSPRILITVDQAKQIYNWLETMYNKGTK